MQGGEEIIKNKIIDFAENDDRIRAVVLNGSRANSTILPDKYQDYDILFVVEKFHSFTENHNWVSFLGNTIIKQLPNEMFNESDNYCERISFSYLMIFEDRNRIDLTLFPKEKFKSDYKEDSLTIVWLDKDQLFENIKEASDLDYRIKAPNEKDFLDTCNEFWWVSTYVAKGLKREEIFYAKDMLESVVRPMFMKLLEWKIGVDNDFDVSFGKSGKFAKKYLEPNFYKRVLKTYSDSNLSNNWRAFIEMLLILKGLEIEVSKKLNISAKKIEAENTLEFILKIKNE
ncbi:aminoglycoside 6-adenylyltransferase [Flavobacterium aquidurense]|uniref:aminoglycoside 6-adenylyltransferase n=1 Tax=Flavobacterium aquidurense TaxID=362413 RepID=UPI00372405FE